MTNTMTPRRVRRLWCLLQAQGNNDEFKSNGNKIARFGVENRFMILNCDWLGSTLTVGLRLIEHSVILSESMVQ